ncbi:MAG: hypothetical protein ACKUBY_00465 [Candidatus Moraniibacteriota bacterium]|jgi:hypothetical protein
MKKYQIIGGLAIVTVMSSSVVFAAPADRDAMIAERDAKKAERETIIEDKKVEREAAIADKKEELDAKKVERICERVDKTILRLKDRSAKREEINSSKLEDRLVQVQDKRVMQNKELQEQRQKRDGQRETSYNNLEEKAQTDEQIAAVSTFKATVEEAVIVRREAIDAATLALQEAVDALVEEKKATVTASYSEYQASYNTAIAASEGACSEDATADDLKNIAKDLNAELKGIATTFRKEVQEMKQVGPEVQELVAVRKAAVKDAISAFKVTVDAARAELIEAFGGELALEGDKSDADESDDVDNDEDELEEKE